MIHTKCKKCGQEARLEETAKVRGAWYRFYVCPSGHLTRLAGHEDRVMSPEEQLEAMREINRILEDESSEDPTTADDAGTQSEDAGGGRRG